MAKLFICLLGSLRTELDDRPVTDFATDKARALLAYLVTEADRAHRRDVLAGLLWPDQPQRRARQNLRQTLSYLRQAIDDRDEDVPFLLVSRETIQFNLESDHWLDVATFTSLATTCRDHRHRRQEACLPCLRRMEQMIALYQGDFLEQFFLEDSDPFEEWALLTREWLHHQVVDILSLLANYYERRGDYAQARQHILRQVTLEPWREEAHRQLMRLLALNGQRSAALAQYETCRRALVEELGVEPTAETQTLYEHIRAEELGSRGARGRSPSLLRSPALSPLASFVGREIELAEITNHLANPDCRLLTLLGPGGIGKTRLALQLAEDHLGVFTHGVVFVPLVSISAPELLPSAVADALGFSFHGQQAPAQQLVDYLREKEILLILDSMERILEGCALLAEILLRAPDVVFLVTSRERLNLQEEWVYGVKGLTCPKETPLPPAGEPDSVDTPARYSAVELFRQRACQAGQGFVLSEEEMLHVVRICRLLEGMPLGIELAAAWVGTRSCEEIAREIKDHFAVLATPLDNVPERQRSVRATFNYSWDLLSEPERTLFACLSVFRGGFRREAADQVAGASSATLAALLNKSLIRRGSHDRYDMHEFLRQCAAEKLRGNPQECQEVQLQHARYFAAFLTRQEEHLREARQKHAFQEVVAEIENARRAWEVAVVHGCADLVEQSLESLYHFYNVQSRFQEGVDLFARAVDHWRDDARYTSTFARVLSRQGALCYHLGLYREAEVALEQSLASFESQGADAEQILCLLNLAAIARKRGDYDRAERSGQKSLALSRRLGNDLGVASSLLSLSYIQYRTGDIAQAEVLLKEDLAIARGIDNRRLLISSLNLLGDIVSHQGDYARAQTIFEECLALSRELGDRFHTAVHLNNLGTVMHVLEKYADARSFYQESLEICREIGAHERQVLALSNLGEVAHELGEHAEAVALYREGLAIARDIQSQRAITICLNNLGEAACALGDYWEAEACLVEALQITSQTQRLALLLKTLVALGVLFARQGHEGQAATLLELVRCHPGSPQEVRERVERLMDDLDLSPSKVPPPPLDEIVEELLAALATHTKDGAAE